MSFSRLASLLVAEGRLHERENRLAEAALIYAEVTHLGTELSRGGFRLAGIACEAIGSDHLAKLVPKLSGAEARAALLALEQADSSRTRRENLARNHRRFKHHQRQQQVNLVKPMGGRPARRPLTQRPNRNEWLPGLSEHVGRAPPSV